MSNVVSPDYSSIEPVREIVEVWLELLGGDEWGEVMYGLLTACQTDYGFADEDCALFATKLLENLEAGYENPGYPPEPKALAGVQKRCREIREYWKRGGNLGDFGNTIETASRTLAQIPPWVFGDEEPE